MSKPLLFQEFEEEKPSVDIASELARVKNQLTEIMEQTQVAKAFPVALLDSQRLQEIILGTSNAYNQALIRILEQFEKMQKTGKRSELTEIKQIIEQSTQQFTQIYDSLTQIIGFISTLRGNVDLEREVLTQLNVKLKEQ